MSVWTGAHQCHEGRCAAAHQISWPLIELFYISHSPESEGSLMLNVPSGHATTAALSPVTDDRQPATKETLKILSQPRESDQRRRPGRKNKKGRKREKSQRGKHQITGSVISHSTLIAPCAPSLVCLSLSHAHRGEYTDVSVTSPGRESERSLDTEIRGSKSMGRPRVADKKIK